VSVPDQLHRHAKAVLDVIERKGVRLDEAQVRALEYIVPPTLTDDEAVELLQALISQGEALVAGQDPHDVLAAVDQAVRDLKPSTMRVKVDGKDRPDLASQPDTETRTPEDAALDQSEHERGAGDDEAKETATAYDLVVIVEKLPESVVESWLSFRRGLETDGFAAWRDMNRGAELPGQEWTLFDAALTVDRAADGGRWSVMARFDLRSPTGQRDIEHHFFIDRSDDGLPVAERISMFTVRP
jgi:hypothetical protein